MEIRRSPQVRCARIRTYLARFLSLVSPLVWLGLKLTFRVQNCPKPLFRICRAAAQDLISTNEIAGHLSVDFDHYDHGCFSSQSFWKAGSVRKGSQIGSSLRRAGVTTIGRFLDLRSRGLDAKI